MSIQFDTPEGERAFLAVLAERSRQINVEHHTPAEDDEMLDAGELATAGGCYVMAAADHLNPRTPSDGWSFSGPPAGLFPEGWDWKPENAERALIKGIALAIAELERLYRAQV